jgi:hypothetical protein
MLANIFEGVKHLIRAELGKKVYIKGCQTAFGADRLAFGANGLW